MRTISYSQGYAKSKREAAHPELWEGMQVAIAPPLGPTGTDVVDACGQNFGSFKGAITGATWVQSELGYAIDVAGLTNSCIYFPSFEFVDYNFDYSLAVWFKAAGTSDTQYIFSRRHESSNSHQIVVAGDVAIFNIYDGSYHRVGSAFTDTSEWHFMLVTQDQAANVVGYLDGVVMGAAGANKGSSIEAGATIGCQSGSGSFQWDGQLSTLVGWDRIIGYNDAEKIRRLGPTGILERKRRRFFSVSQISAAITGSASSSITEADIVAGGKTTIITLTGDTWVTAGPTFNAQRQAIIDGVTSAQSEATGWNAEVRDKEIEGSVTRDSDTVVTITWTSAASYDISAQEIITVTVTAAALTTSSSEVVGSPTFTVDTVSSGAIKGSLALMGVGA